MGVDLIGHNNPAGRTGVAVGQVAKIGEHCADINIAVHPHPKRSVLQIGIAERAEIYRPACGNALVNRIRTDEARSAILRNGRVDQHQIARLHRLNPGLRGVFVFISQHVDEQLFEVVHVVLDHGFNRKRRRAEDIRAVHSLDGHRTCGGGYGLVSCAADPGFGIAGDTVAGQNTTCGGAFSPERRRISGFA